MTNQGGCIGAVPEVGDYASIRDGCHNAKASLREVETATERCVGVEVVTMRDAIVAIAAIVRAQQALDDLAVRLRDLPSNATEN